MDAEQTRRRIPDIPFRVLIIGRANAGKTSILLRVCETTESPDVYREGEKVRGPSFVSKSDLTANQVQLDPSMDVSNNGTSLWLPLVITEPARRAHDRRRTGVLQSSGLCFSRF
jgi:GTPase SAR1 family protein